MCYKQHVSSKLLSLIRGNNSRAQLIRSGVGSLMIQAGNALLAFAVAVVLARLLGPEGYGVYSFAIAVIMTVAIPAQIGVPQLLVRETAKAQVNGDFGLMRGLWRWGNFAVAALSVFGSFLAGGVIWAITDIAGKDARAATLVLGIALIPIVSLSNVRGACMKGLRKVVKGLLPESVIRPLLLLAFLLGWARWFIEYELSPQMVMIFYIIASLLAFLVGWVLLYFSRPSEMKARPDVKYQLDTWRKAVIPLGLISGLHLVNSYADLIILGFYRPDEDVGIYRAASQLALLIIFGLQAINQVLHPHFSRLYFKKDMEKLQYLVTNSARVILILAFIPFCVFLFFGDNVLNLVFGLEYEKGEVALVILALGQLANAAFGSVGALLNMTGHEHDTMRGMLIAMAVNIALNFVLIPIYGFNGAAMATAVSYLMWNAVLRYFVRKRLAIESAAFGFKVFSNIKI